MGRAFTSGFIGRSSHHSVVHRLYTVQASLWSGLRITGQASCNNLGDGGLEKSENQRTIVSCSSKTIRVKRRELNYSSKTPKSQPDG